MRVLVISQMVFNETNNMGKTLMSYFKGWNPKDIAQLYFHSFDPTNTAVCENYYRFSDVDAVKSIGNRRIVGKRFSKQEVHTQEDGKRTDEGLARKAYVVGARHHAWTVMARDFAWKISNWKNKELIGWVEEFNPDVFFFAAGDCEFSYHIAYWFSQKMKKPLVTLCVDDYYIHNRNEGEFLGRCRHKMFMKTALKTLKRSSIVLTICDSMKREYEHQYGLKCEVLHTAAQVKQLDFIDKPFRLAYFGNLGYFRDQQLVSMGKAVADTSEKTGVVEIDVYSGSISSDLISNLTKANGVRFNGAISPSEVTERMRECIAVIHTESFDEEKKKQVRFSVSTKIAESLMYGPCLIAYGPEEIASIDYLQENNAAYVITRPEDLESGLTEILTNKELREQIVRNARALAIKNHNAEVNPKKVRRWLEQVVKNSKAIPNGEE